MWIVAGPNGSGKTTLVQAGPVRDLLSGIGNFINPDETAALLRRSDPGLSEEEASVRAARMTDAQVDRHIEDGNSFLVETVLSSDKYKSRVDRAIQHGYSIGLIFVVLKSPHLSVARIRQRVEQAGHDVPTAKVHSRWPKSIANLRWFAERADVAYVFDNSAIGNPVLLAERSAGSLRWHHRGRIPEVDRSLEGL